MMLTDAHMCLPFRNAGIKPEIFDANTFADVGLAQGGGARRSIGQILAISAVNSVANPAAPATIAPHPFARTAQGGRLPLPLPPPPAALAVLGIE